MCFFLIVYNLTFGLRKCCYENPLLFESWKNDLLKHIYFYQSILKQYDAMIPWALSQTAAADGV